MSNITAANYCFSAHRARSLNDRINIPFYIYAPDYRDSSGGIRVLHYLCHILNEMGEEAYLINTGVASPRLRTPRLTLSKLRQHFLSGANPVTIYPEIISHNPANTPLIIRWLLNIPGHLGKPIEFEPKDLLFYYEAWCLPENMNGSPLFIHPVDHTYFNNDDNPDDDNRTLECFYANKYHIGKKPVLKEHENLISLGQEIKRTHEEIAGILRKSKALYCYEPSGIISEAQACGCPVILVRSEYWPLPPDDTHHKIPGLAIYGEENHLEKANQTLPRIPDVHAKARDNSWVMTKNMVHEAYQAQEDLLANGKPCSNEIQELWALEQEERKKHVDRFNELYLDSEINFGDVYSSTNPSTSQALRKPVRKPVLTDAYKNWLDLRNAHVEQSRALEKLISGDFQCPHDFHFIVRLVSGQEAALANSLDSLGQQLLQNWHLDILAPLEAPDGLNEIPCITWHDIRSWPMNAGATSDLVRGRKCSFVIEIPPGAILDPRYLWRISVAAEQNPSALAFFTDDDHHDVDFNRLNPRFKPGVNPAALVSSDLAGPLAIRLEAWLDAAERSAGEWQNPWFSKLLKLSDLHGWEFIKHIPDILISHPENSPESAQVCHEILNHHLKDKGIAAEILPVTERSWCIHHALHQTPETTIAIISRGRQEDLSRLLDSLFKYTRYENKQVLVVAAEANLTPPILSLVRDKKTDEKFDVQSLVVKTDDNHAALCNAAIKAARGEFVLLLDEEAQIVQESWLSELVRSAIQTGVAAVAPRIIQPGTSSLQHTGNVLGLNGLVDSPYRGTGKYGDSGYLDSIQTAHDISALPEACALIRKSSYLKAGGMDETVLANHLSMTELSLKLRENGERLLYQPLSNLVFQAAGKPGIPRQPADIALEILAADDAQNAFLQRHWPAAAIDPFWNSNLSLVQAIPTPEADFMAEWQIIPNDLPRIFARPVSNGQGYYRITSSMEALKRDGKISSGIWVQGGTRDLSPAELIRLSPDSLIVQNYLGDVCLNALAKWHSTPGRPFIVYALDDLITDLAESNPLRVTIPPDCRERLKYALTRCDRMVVSTEFLAESYRHLVSDIKVVPNCLEQKLWLPLYSRKRTSEKPRIGWAGGSTHQDDLILLKEIIEQTRNEADWIFMGMCPEEIRPLLTEYHPFVDMNDYPMHLASLNLDIAVAPLAITPFNMAKSNLRLLEYGMLAIPVVCTDIEPYRDSPACRVPNTPEAWIDALRERIYNTEAREEEGRCMRSWVQQRYLLENRTVDWLEAHLPN